MAIDDGSSAALAPSVAISRAYGISQVLQMLALPERVKLRAGRAYSARHQTLVWTQCVHSIILIFSAVGERSAGS